MPAFVVEGDCRAALVRLFKSDEDGYLRLGGSAHSVRPAGHDDLLAGPVRFSDFLMEGGLAYTVQAVEVGQGSLLRIQGEGSNRDQFILSAVRCYITHSGLVITAESNDDLAP